MKFKAGLFNPTPQQDLSSRYRVSDPVRLAVNAALAAARPLLVEGPPGSGKSTLASAIARSLGWRYYEKVVTSRTQATDLLYTYDSLARLADAQARKLKPDQAYLEPRVLWWAVNPTSASRRGKGKTAGGVTKAEDPKLFGDGVHAVVLLDEIDKADPDVPNDLLVPLDGGAFHVDETRTKVAPDEDLKCLLILTTNGERELSAAFLRRCVLLTLTTPSEDELVEIARLHEPDAPEQLSRQLARWLLGQAEVARKRREREPSTAEFLDAIRACRQLEISPEAKGEAEENAWKALCNVILSKVGRGPGAAV